jgi:hypothetical protein
MKLPAALEYLMLNKLRNELDAMQAIAERSYDDKRIFCRTMQEENQPCWGELRPYSRLKQMFAHITLEEYAGIMARADAALEAEKAEKPARQQLSNQQLCDAVNNDLKKKRWAKHSKKP